MTSEHCETTGNAFVICAHKILRLHLQLKPYHLKHLQTLNDNDLTERYEFAHWFLYACANDDNFLENIMWTDEAHFYLHGQMTSRNCVIWSKDNPHAVTTSLHHSPKVNVWYAFTAKHMLPPFFFTDTVDGAAYLYIWR